MYKIKNELSLRPRFGQERPNWNADVVKLVDTLDLGSSALRCESSSLSIRTNKWYRLFLYHFLFKIIEIKWIL